MADTTTLAANARKHLEDQQNAVKVWSAANGVQPRLQSTASAGFGMAQGTFSMGGAVANAVLINLTFDNGEKRNFNGMLFGVAGGLAEGSGVYAGPIPNDGDQWNMTIMAGAAGPGYAMVTFNPFLGPSGTFTCATAGTAGSLMMSNYGGGHWRNG